MKKKTVYSEKMKKNIEIEIPETEEEKKLILDDTKSSTAGWVHGGWNNDGGTVW